MGFSENQINNALKWWVTAPKKSAVPMGYFIILISGGYIDQRVFRRGFRLTKKGKIAIKDMSI
jgi:hypothetical protein